MPQLSSRCQYFADRWRSFSGHGGHQKLLLTRYLFVHSRPPGAMMWITGVTLAWFASVTEGMPDPSQRDLLMLREASRQTGGRVTLTEAERKLDARLRRAKERELSAEPFPPAVHFFRAKPLIQQSWIFKVLQRMPKGAALHVHGSSLVGVEWLVKNVTYRPHCYMCSTWDGSVRFLFSARRPFPRWDCLYWQPLDALRARAGDPAGFDDSLTRHLTLVTEDPEAEYPSQDVVWDKFEKAFAAAAGLITHAPVLRDYLYKGLEELRRDNVMYLEVRSGLSRTYELDGTVHDKVWTLKMFEEVTGNFVADHPGFLGARVIISVHRALGAPEVKAAVKEAVQLREDFPETVAGFDVVGREDGGTSLWHLREALSVPARLGVGLPYFFHAGETDGETENVVDALLFETARIGHGYALARHPIAKELSRTRNVAVELCPISNQVLKLVSDLRNHPAAALMSEGHPLVISSDDPSLFGSEGLSYDFYQAFVGIGGLKATLGTLKELALNSIRYSSLSAGEKQRGQAAWEEQWDAFVANEDASLPELCSQ